MAEIDHKPRNPNDEPDAFDPGSLEDPGSDVVLHNPNQGALARPGEVRMTAKLRKVYLSITHGVGGLSEAGFPKGSLVLDKTVEIYAPPKPPKPGKEAEKSEPAIVTVVSVNEFWKQDVPYGSGQIPELYPDEQAALKAGRRTQYPPFNSGLPLPDARPALELQLLVREPEGVQDRGYFLLQIGGSWWAPCTMIADKIAYAEVNDAITRARLAHDAVGGVVAANFALETRSKLIRSTGNFTYVPVFRTVGTKNPADLKETLDKLMGK